MGKRIIRWIHVEPERGPSGAQSRHRKLGDNIYRPDRYLDWVPEGPSLRMVHHVYRCLGVGIPVNGHLEIELLQSFSGALRSERAGSSSSYRRIRSNPGADDNRPFLAGKGIFFGKEILLIAGPGAPLISCSLRMSGNNP